MAADEPTSALVDHAGYWLRYVSNHVSHAFARKVEAQGVTVAEWVLLRLMLQQGPASPSQIAAAAGMTRGAVSKLVDRLCRKGLAVRESSKSDRRFQMVKLSEAGTRLVPVLARIADANDHEFFGHLNAGDRSMLVNLLREMVVRNGWKEIPAD